jgi:hypothetical protein
MSVEHLITGLFKPLLLCNCIFLSAVALPQQKNEDFKFGNISAKDFNVSSSNIKDSDAAAIILYSAGSTHFIGNDKGWFSYVYTCTKRIKILNKKAFDLATIKINVTVNDNDDEVLSDVKAVTYNLNNNMISSIAIDQNDIFTDQADKYHIVKKFTLPGVNEGSVIEYTYTKTSSHYYDMPGWQFQSTKYPVLWSEYEVSIPVTLLYVYVKHGFDSFYLKKEWDDKETYKVKNGSGNNYTSVTAHTVHYQWIEKELEPLKVENYFSSLSNYVDKLEFQLSGLYNGEDSSAVWNSWQYISKYFLQDEDFKEAMSGDNSWIKDLREFKNHEKDLDIAKDIYYFLQNNYECINNENVFSSEDLYDIYKKRKGNVREINLLLIAMLNNKHIYAEPVLLSTRDNGFLNPAYPLLDNFNYIICQTVVGGKSYLLDATNPVLGFGELPDKCYNGYARVIHENRSDSLYLLTDSLKESHVSTLSLNNDKKGTISGTYTSVMGRSESINMREKMKTLNKEDYFKNLKDYLLDADVYNTKIDSLEQKELPVSIQYDIDFKMDDNIVYFNPIAISDALKENPFKAEQRFYPVEMPYCLDKSYILNMQVPDGYTVDELPKSARVSLNDNEGMFQYLIQQTGNHIQLLCHLKLNKSNFEPDDYETLRNFFAFVVQKEGEQIVFKKM